MSIQPNSPVPGKPVMADVARLAGVSHQTVSRGDQRITQHPTRHQRAR